MYDCTTLYFTELAHWRMCHIFCRLVSIPNPKPPVHCSLLSVILEVIYGLDEVWRQDFVDQTLWKLFTCLFVWLFVFVWFCLFVCLAVCFCVANVASLLWKAKKYQRQVAKYTQPICQTYVFKQPFMLGLKWNILFIQISIFLSIVSRFAFSA